MARRLLSQLPPGFDVLQAKYSKHYMIFYDTSTAYAKWCGSLFEQLYKAFNN